MKRRVVSLGLALALISMFTFAPVSAAAAQSGNPMKSIAVTGTGEGGGSFAGTFTIERFAAEGKQIYAIGRLNGVVKGAPGGDKEVKDHPARMPVQASSAAGQGTNQSAASADCPILHLVLGPLDLNLLGLKVHLNQVVLDITAQSGAGNLLGNLLCDIANLLNGGGALGQIVDLLNQILAKLG